MTADNGSAIDTLARELVTSVLPQQGDVLYALERVKATILERTARGVDVDGAPFAPYSSKGPYYYYPGSRTGVTSHKGRIAARDRFAKKLGVKTERKGYGVKFESYGAFKRSLGRGNVDLTGVSAPHMLQALVVKVAKDGKAGQFTGSIAIYGSEAIRAGAHNEGAATLPRRRWFATNNNDIIQFLEDLETRRKARG